MGLTRLGAVTVLGLLPVVGEAQDVNAQRFTPSVDARWFVHLEDSDNPRWHAVGGGAWLNYADDPLTLGAGSADGSDVALLGSVATVSLVAFYSTGPMRFGVDLPVHVYTAGAQLDAAPRLGDLRLSTKLTLLRRDDGGAGVALWGDITLPTGDAEAWVGTGTLGGRGGFAVSASAGPVILVANAGFRTGTGEDFVGLTISPALLWGVGAAAEVSQTVWAALELEGEYWLGNEIIGDERLPGALPSEWLASIHYNPAGDLVVTFGGGTSLSDGIGAPDFRVVGALTWSPHPARRSPRRAASPTAG